MATYSMLVLSVTLNSVVVGGCFLFGVRLVTVNVLPSSLTLAIVPTIAPTADSGVAFFFCFLPWGWSAADAVPAASRAATPKAAARAGKRVIGTAPSVRAWGVDRTQFHERWR